MSSKIKIKHGKIGYPGKTVWTNGDPTSTVTGGFFLDTLEDGELAYNAFNNGLYIGYEGKNHLLSVTNSYGPDILGEVDGTEFHGTADSARKLTVNAGGVNQPVYFVNGVPKAAKAYSEIITDVWSTEHCPIVISAAGEEITTDTLYATYMRTYNNNTQKGNILFSTKSNTTPFADTTIYTTDVEGQLVVPFMINREVKISPGATVSEVMIFGSVALQYNTTKKSLDFIFE